MPFSFPWLGWRDRIRINDLFINQIEWMYIQQPLSIFPYFITTNDSFGTMKLFSPINEAEKNNSTFAHSEMNEISEENFILFSSRNLQNQRFQKKVAMKFIENSAWTFKRRRIIISLSDQKSSAAFEAVTLRWVIHTVELFRSHFSRSSMHRSNFSILISRTPWKGIDGHRSIVLYLIISNEC